MPSLAFCMAIAYLIHLLAKKKPQLLKNFILPAFAMLIVLAYSVKTFARVPVWENAMTLNAAAIKVSKNSARANLFYGTAIFEEYKVTSDPQRKKELLSTSSKYFQKAVQIFPKYGNAHKMVAGVAAEEFKVDRNLNKLLASFESVIRVRPNIDFVHQYLEYLNGRGTYNVQLIDYYYRVGYEYLSVQKKDYPWAMKFLEYGLVINPNEPRILYAIGKTFQAAGNHQKAAEYLARAKALDPSLG